MRPSLKIPKIETEAPPRDWADLWLHAEKVPNREASGVVIDRLLAIADPTTRVHLSTRT